jgi:hypothetical protein
MRYLRAADADGRTWGSPIELSTFGTFPTLAIIEGRPAVAYSVFPVLLFRRALDAAGTNWEPPVTIDNAASVGSPVSLQVVNGVQAIAYGDSVDADVHYVQASDATGAAWGVPVIAAAAANALGASCALAEVNDRPAIAYLDSTARRLYFVRAQDGNGAAWGTPLEVGTGYGCTSSVNLTMVAGRAALAWVDASLTTSGVGRFARAIDVDGLTWASSEQISTDRVYNLALVLVGGLPALTYTYSPNGENWVMYQRAVDSVGTAWSNPLRVGHVQVGTNPVKNTLIDVLDRPAFANVELYNGSQTRLNFYRGF